MRRHLTYSNVVATLALFLVLGGGIAVAAALKKNSVKSKQIAANAVKGSEIKNGAVTTDELADGAATGAKVDEASLGRVPSAADAGTLGGKSAADLQVVSAFGQNTSNVTLALAPTTVAIAELTTTSPSLIQASATASMTASPNDPNNSAFCTLDIDGTPSGLYSGDADDVGTSGTNYFVIAAEFARYLPAGDHLVQLNCSRPLASNAVKDTAAINATAVPGPPPPAS